MRFLAAGALLASLAAGAPTGGNQSVYEYIVVGSGPGGGPLAANLARAGHSVLLLEAGGDHGNAVTESVPVLGAFNAETNEAGWQFFVNHYRDDTQARRDDKYTYMMPNGSYYIGLDPPAGAEPLGMYYPRGATVGGSSQTNAMSVALPPQSDWEEIAAITGDDSWSPESIRQIWMALERNTYMPRNATGYGFDGYLATAQNTPSHTTDRPSQLQLLREATRLLEDRDVETQEEVNALLLRDLNDPRASRYMQPGVYGMPSHINEQDRRVGARDHVMNTVNAENGDGSKMYPLTLSTQSLATKVLFTPATDKKKPRAYGVEYLVGEAMYSGDRRYDAAETGEKRKAIATREVIVAGGAFNTPQILKLSGVGPASELEELGIPVVADLPAVGKYLQDNYESSVIVRASYGFENALEDCLLDFENFEADPCYQQWLRGEGGPYAEAGAGINMLFRSSVSKNEDADILFFGSPGIELNGFYPGYSQGRIATNVSYSWSMVKMQVGNQAGTVELRSTNPRDTPIINFNYFEQQAEQDLQAFTEGYEFAMELFNALGEPYTPFTPVEPAPNATDIRQSIMDRAFGHHATSSCRMGPKDNPEYCVDSKFKVNGVDGLRVVDASIFPRTPGGFTVGPTFIIGQKAFEVIQEELEDGNQCRSRQ